MGLVAAKCTQCGSNIDVDDTKDAGICSSCGTAFVTQKAITHYNTYLTQQITKNIYGKEKTEVEEYLANGETFLKLKDWENAYKTFKQASESAPDNYKCWLGLVKCSTKNFTILNDRAHIDYYQKATAVASEEEKKILISLCGEFNKLSDEHLAKVDKFNKGNIAKGTVILLSMIFGAMSAVIGLILGILLHWGFFLLSAFGSICLTVAIICNIIDIKKAKEINDAANIEAK